MKCLVFSDTHGDFTYARAAMALHRDCEVVFFLGDGLRDIEQLASIYPTVAFIAVRGNCDFNDDFCGAECKKVESITLLGKRIVLTHGDLYSAKSGDERLLYLARERGADILLYGHTHTPRQEYLSEPLDILRLTALSSSRRGGIRFFPTAASDKKEPPRLFFYLTVAK